MPRYDVYLIDNGYVVDLQTDIVEIPGSRVVAPIVPMRDVPVPTKLLHPQVIFRDEAYVIATHLLAAAPISLLKTPLANLVSQGEEITRALDILFQGY